MGPKESDADIPIPALYRAARGAYAHSMREQLSEVGISDLPPNGGYIVGGLARGAHAGQLFREIGLRESVRSRLLGALLERHYVRRGTGEAKYGLDDLALTEKGRRAADACARGVSAVTEELVSALSAEEYAAFRKGLTALIDIKERQERHAHEHEHGHDHVHPHEDEAE
jgi:DNA-binding MarR family transcriptional regulator